MNKQYPDLPEWSKRDDLGGLVPSEIRTELRSYADAARGADMTDADKLRMQFEAAFGDVGVDLTPCSICKGQYADVYTSGLWLGYQIGYDDGAQLRNDWPAGLLDRIDAAIQRIENNRAPRSIPANVSDVDLVLSEVRSYIKGYEAPFWLSAAQEAGQP